MDIWGGDFAKVLLMVAMLAVPTSAFINAELIDFRSGKLNLAAILNQRNPDISLYTKNNER